MSLEKHSYYLQQLGLTQWQSKSSLIMPKKSLLSKDSTILFIMNLALNKTLDFEIFMGNVASTIGRVKQNVSYVIYNELKPLNYDSIILFLKKHDQKIFILGNNDFQEDFKKKVINVPSTYCITLDLNTLWQSYEVKKGIMNGLLVNELL